MDNFFEVTEFQLNRLITFTRGKNCYLKIGVVHLSHEHNQSLNHGEAEVGKERIPEDLGLVVGRRHVVRGRAVVVSTALVLQD